MELILDRMTGPQSISEHVDGGTSRYDRNGIIYQAICANCADHSVTPFPTSPGVWSPRNGTGGAGCNLAAIKIAFNFAGVSADPRSIINGRYRQFRVCTFAGSLYRYCT